MHIDLYPLEDCLFIIEDGKLDRVTIYYYSDSACTTSGCIETLQIPNMRRCHICRELYSEEDALVCERSHEGKGFPPKGKRGPYRSKEPSLYLNKEKWKWDDTKSEYYKVSHKERKLNKEETQQIKKYLREDLKRVYHHIPRGPVAITYFNLRNGCRWNRSWGKSGGMDE